MINLLQKFQFRGVQNYTLTFQLGMNIKVAFDATRSILTAKGKIICLAKKLTSQP